MSRILSQFLVAAFVLAASSPLIAQGSPAGSGEESVKRPWTVDDVVMQESASSWTLSDDGSQALWIKRRPNKKKDRSVSTLMLTDMASAKHRELTVGQDGISSARFVPGGKKVSFTTSRKFPAGMKAPGKEGPGSQIWILDLAGGEARPLTSIETGVFSYHWHDENTIFLSTREPKSRRELTEKKDKDDTIVVEDMEAFLDRRARLFRFDVKKKTLKRLTDNREPLGRFSVSPNGRWVLAIYNRSPHFEAESDVPPRVLLHDLTENTAVELFADRKSKPSSFHWSKDSQRAFMSYPHASVDGENWAAIVTLKELILKDGSVRDVDLAHDWGMSGGMTVLEDGFIASLANGVRPIQRLYRRLADGSYRGEDLKGGDAKRAFSLLKAKDADRVIYVTGSASEPDTVKTARLKDGGLEEPRELYRPNQGFKNKKIAKTEIRRWKGALDEEVEGIVYYPHDYQEGKRYPLVLITHGGPHGADRDRFSERWANSPNLYCQRGAFVLKTNYHGSSDYGLAFGEAIKGKYYELELIDMFSGIKMLEDEGKIDREQMGVVGWSNGAILSTAAVTLAHRFAPGFDYTFKVCAPGAGDVNWTSDYGNCRFGGSFDEFYLGGTPWSNLEGYVAKSPLFEVERVTTPTIIFFGTKDRAVPTEQGWQWFRALNRVKKAPVRFLLFPGQPHGLQKITHQRRKLNEELAWVDRYLFDKKDQKEEDLIQKGSPLDVALAELEFARFGDTWGVLQGATLVPETVAWTEKVEVGRFEVTRAQWAAFDATVDAADRPDHPMVGVSDESARKYVAFLREKTGRDWRLITRAEFKKLSSVSGPSENTLDYWAGYHPNLEEAAVLRKKLEALGVTQVLSAAGSRKPGIKKVGEERRFFYDLGGNAAELVIDADGKLTAVGGCAIVAKDQRASEESSAPRAWTGLRLAVGPVPEEKKK